MKQLTLKKNILESNDDVARKLKNYLDEKKIYTINLLGSPGAGKTTVLEHLIERLRDRITVGVIEGDLYTTRDAQRIEAHNIEVVQVNTGGGCHLDASMIERAVDEMNIEALDLLVIENVGNLVCPASYDLSEDMRIVVISTTEGNDKPLKYPAMFKSADIVVLNKTDLIEYTDFNLDEFYSDVKSINRDIKVINVSCRENKGIEELSNLIISEINNKRGK
ncbi:hydrogenase nickel incorporation protein HypB [Clostridium cylindrosporum]|uniref:Hydrogenase nickel incorporation protein HypB n=1 Tax=Clostridium cylindrosporum DSM 605 TaxID=1121307 RepID=A0A0J8DDC4_CLOCY|nr:hydrogenase nickel incorporation protein HypB [Clostridium cylindrosporum]KMT22238.1 hydrogenase nickel incorporation protein HypB [Clostridium cylindrosporum DSM 605]